MVILDIPPLVLITAMSAAHAASDVSADRAMIATNRQGDEVVDILFFARWVFAMSNY